MWEGDFRLWEAMSSGALVFVDPLMVPHPHPLLHMVHLVHFQQHNASDLIAQLDYFLSHPLEARRIARAGYLHVMTHHRTVNSIDYILRTAETKRAAITLTGGGKVRPTFAYTHTGQFLVQQTRRQEKRIKRTKLPGRYDI
jgi:hypothetical protein